MPRPTLYLNIPKPCPEDWQAMTPTGAGRHCAACDKGVVDFTRMTDGELVAWFQRHRGQRVCGHFSIYQLGRPLLPLPEPAPVWRQWALAALAIVGFGESAAAQAGGRGAAIQVVDVRTGLPIAGARVIIHEGSRLRSVLTDSSGCVWKAAPRWWKVDVIHPDYYQTQGRAVAPYEPTLAGGVIRRIALAPFAVEVAVKVTHITEVSGPVPTSPFMEEGTSVPQRGSGWVDNVFRKIFRRRHREGE